MRRRCLWAAVPAAVLFLVIPRGASSAPGARVAGPDVRAAGPDVRAAEIAQRVSRGHLEKILLELTGERPFWIEGEEFRIDTRRSGTAGMEAAARLLEEEFARSGLETCRFEYLGWHFEDISFADSLHGWTVGDGGVILATVDGGRHWVRRGPAAEQLHAVAALTAERAVATGRTGVVLRTENGGAGWEWTETGSRRLRGMSFVDSVNGWVCGDNGDVFRTRDGGRGWTRQHLFMTERLNAVSFVDSLRGWIVGRKGHVLRTEDGGLSWSASQIDGQPDLYGVFFLDALTGWMASEDGIVRRTVDAGDTWTAAALDTVIPLYDLEFTDAGSGWVVGGGGLIYRTADGGVTWTRLESGATGDLKALARGGTRTWIAGHSALLVTEDGTAWESREEAVEDRWINVVGTLSGTVEPESCYILCGHFDSISEMADLRAPGADDNASGTALVVAAARALGHYRFEKTIKFMCFSGEEQGLRGSAHIAAALSQGGLLPLGVINADMIGYDARGERDVWISYRGDEPSRTLALVCSTLADDHGMDLNPYITDEAYGASDHDSFVEINIPAVMVSHADATMYPYIHSVADRYSELDLAYAQEVIRLVVVAAATLAGPVDDSGTDSGEVLRLADVYPNPTTASTTIRFLNPVEGRVTLRLYDVEGRLL